MHSIILDIETLSRRPHAIITEIAAIAVTLENGEPLETSSIGIDLCIASQLAARRHFEPETIQFHQQHNTLPESFQAQLPLKAANNLIQFIEDHQPRTVWIWGKDFDRPILESFYQFVGLPFPWKYWQTACARDAYKLAFGHDAKPPKRTHSAINDCRDTLRDLTAALTKLDRLHHL
jgi:hypothetical protein